MPTLLRRDRAAALLAGHLTRLTDSLDALRDRVREAVAGELSRLVGDALGEAIRTLLGPRPDRRPGPADRGYDPRDDEGPEAAEGLPPAASDPQPAARPWAAWLAAAGRLLLAGRGRPWWPALALAGAGVAALTGQPLVLAALAAAHTALDLLCP